MKISHISSFITATGAGESTALVVVLKSWRYFAAKKAEKNGKTARKQLPFLKIGL